MFNWDLFYRDLPSIIGYTIAFTICVIVIFIFKNKRDD